jgi:hypothetical protein
MRKDSRTKETETPRRRAYRHAHLFTARIHDHAVYARKKKNPDWVQHRKELADQERLNLKIEVLTRYGGAGSLQCCWGECLVQDVDMLTLDHTFNNGARDRRENKCGCGSMLYRRLRRMGYPDGFQTLCGSHQMKKKIMFERENV